MTRKRRHSCATAPRKAARDARIADELPGLVEAARPYTRTMDPSKYYQAQGKTYADYVDFAVKSSGAAGRSRWAKTLRAIIANAEGEGA